MPNLYTTLAQIKARLNITTADTTYDAILGSVIEAVSREIDQYCGRWFFPQTATRYYTPRSGRRILVDDLIAVTSLKTDEDGDRTYEVTWATTDYDLMPDNAALGSPPEPYWEIRTSPDGDYSFPCIARGVEIAGRWGYYDQRATSTATLNEVLDTSETGVDVTDGTQFEAGQTILIDSEQMYVSAIATNTLTVTRAVNGTTAATHASAAAIQVYQYPIISEACLFQAALAFRAKDAPMGIAGGGDFTQQIRAVGLHPFVTRMLALFRRPAVG